MTEFCLRMLEEEEADSPETCRERRCRRIEMRRFAAAAAAAATLAPAPPPFASSSSSSYHSFSPLPETSRRVRSDEAVASGSDDPVPGEGSETEPCFGMLSVPGRSRYMEDTVAVRIAIASPGISRQLPVHFFAVYDGHGGSHIAELCKERMNVIVAEEMGRLRFERGSSEVAGESGERESEEEEWWWKRVMKRSFARMDFEAINISTAAGVDFSVVGGCTASVTLLTPEHIVVANVGDSRTVLCRRGLAVPLSRDHKPDRSDELARIEAAGGRVIYVNEARVEGILAMSRAIGDKYLKPYVISEPEITFTKRGPEDECLIIASDGLWDVLSSDMACRVAAECISSVGLDTRPIGSQIRVEERVSGQRPSRTTLTAAILTRLALGRRSLDNISVIVVDLRRNI